MDAVVDRGTGVPPSIQLEAGLRRLIASGELTGELPSERSMAQLNDVSVGLVRKVYGILRTEGLIETYRGYGSRVVPPEERLERE